MSVINQKQRMILEVLDKQARLHHSKISKLCSIPKSVVTYNVNILKEKKIIKGFATLIDHSSLGYFELRSYINTYKNDPQKELKFIEHLKKMNNTGVVVRCIGDYDLVVSFYVKDIAIFWNTWFKTLHSYKPIIKNYSFNIIVEKELFPFFKKASENKSFTIGNKKEKNIDNVDEKLLDLLTQNCRRPIHEIATELDLSSSSVIHRIKKLEKNEVILGYYTIFNFSKLKKIFCRLQVQMEQIKDLDLFTSFIKETHSIISIAKIIGAGNDLEIDFLVNTVDELFQLIGSIKGQFPNSIRDYQYIRVTDTIKWSHKPLL